jgi:hypothetical protein
VRTDSATDGTLAALFAPGIPRDGDPLDPSNPFSARVTGVDAEPVDESDVVFLVTAQYEGSDFEAVAVHPLDRLPEFSWGAESFDEPYFYDESQPKRKPFVNAAGDPFETEWSRAAGDMTIQMVRNEPIWDVLAADFYKNTTNADIVILDGQAYAVDTLALGPLTATKTSEEWMGTTVTYYKVTYPFKARKDGWKDKPLNYGYQQLLDTGDVDDDGNTIYTKVPILDGAGLKIQKPWPLTLEGKAMPSATDVPPELEFLPFRSVPWGPLYFS